VSLRIRPYTPPMPLQQAACERRVYRLATLLTGDLDAATGIMEAVLRAQPDLRAVESARLDRLTVLRCREVSSRPLLTEDLPGEAARAIASLGAQPHEVWLLVRAYGLPLREAARAMDCSVTATTRHLQRADETMAGALGGGVGGSIEALRAYSKSVQVPASYLAGQQRRRRHRRVLTMVLLLLLALVLLAIADLLSPG